MRKTTSVTKRLQCKKLAKVKRDSADSNKFFNLLTSELLFNKLEDELPEHRERLFHPTETLSMFLAQAMSGDRSCQNVVNRHAVERLCYGLKAPSVRTGGYCRARKRLPTHLVKCLTEHLAKEADTVASDKWRWRSKRVRIVDGTTLTMPDTEANQEAFPQSGGQEPGLGFPICRLVGITSLETGMLMNAAVGRCSGKGGDEQTLLRSLWNTFESGDVILGDAYFATYFFIAEMQKRGIDLLLEQHGTRRQSTDFRKGKRLGHEDHIIEYPKPKLRPYWMNEKDYLDSPEVVRVRELKRKGKIYVTTLMCHKSYSKEELSGVYKQRWNIEIDLRHIKDTLGMNILSCKSPEMVTKEIWVYMLAYNLLRVLMAQSALLSDLVPRQLSFKHCLQLWSWTQVKFLGLESSQFQQLMMLIAVQRNGERSGRIEPRAVKRRPKPYPLLTVPRDQAREEVRKNGHPKKLK